MTLFADRFVKGASVVKCMGHDWTYWLGDKLIPGFHELLIARTRLIDEFVKEEVAGCDAVPDSRCRL